MKLEGFLLWVAMSVLTTSICNLLFRFSWFTNQTNLVSNVKLTISLIISEIVSVTYILFNNTLGIFGLWGISLYPLEDAILSGILIWGGADVLYQIYATIIAFKEKVKAQAEQEKTLSERLKQ